jgi:hypothetical protein
LLGGEWLELLSEIAPGLKRAAIMFNPDTATPVSIFMPSLETAAHQPADLGILSIVIGRGNLIMCRERRDLHALSSEEHVTINKEGVGPVAHQGGEGCLDLKAGAGVENLNLKSDGD